MYQNATSMSVYLYQKATEGSLATYVSLSPYLPSTYYFYYFYYYIIINEFTTVKSESAIGRNRHWGFPVNPVGNRRNVVSGNDLQPDNSDQIPVNA